MKLHLVRHIGFIRMSGCLLVYARGRTLSDHQLLVCQTPGFRWMTIHQRGALARALRDEVLHCADRERLLSYARQWLYQHRLIIVHGTRSGSCHQYCFAISARNSVSIRPIWRLCGRDVIARFHPEDLSSHSPFSLKIEDILLY
ncbi:hypothetical protein [Cupriavidus sp. D39]|uniref:hypothetical protein n=1 Tax=Cupriavidus sp. D39 TaxID=2997877 RepID=UPI002270F9C1|nr:hypothetical protein [Cupriavidus sp. D39]MCY0853153.1 hypothetical protein [Cupriavidus sp. D39]